MKLNDRWARHDRQWRNTADVVSLSSPGPLDAETLRYRVRGPFWDILEEKRATLLVTREYEHLVVALSVLDGKPDISFVRLPHPSGLVYDRKQHRLYIASTRNPNQILEFRPTRGRLPREDTPPDDRGRRRLVPVAARYYPGSTYLHDLALISGKLHANAVGDNAVVRVDDAGTLERVFWPRSIDSPQGPRFGRNYLQLNSIAAGATLEDSFFTASSAVVSSRRPGQRHFPVDGRGVLFSGRTREPVASGLTRPHSARLYRSRTWLANSGYGALGIVRDERFEPVTRLSGWTRGLTFVKGTAFVGTSRVLPRFHRYAPGLDVDKSRCAVHAVDPRSGEVLASLTWPAGNQIFALDWAPSSVASGFPFTPRRNGASAFARSLFYAFQTGD